MKVYDLNLLGIKLTYRKLALSHTIIKIMKRSIYVRDRYTIDGYVREVKERDVRVKSLDGSFLRQPLDSLLHAARFSYCVRDCIHKLSTNSLADWMSVTAERSTYWTFVGTIDIGDGELFVKVYCPTYRWSQHNELIYFASELSQTAFLLDRFGRDATLLERFIEEEKQTARIHIPVDVRIIDHVIRCYTTEITKSRLNMLLWLLQQPRNAVDDFVRFALRKQSGKFVKI